MHFQEKIPTPGVPVVPVKEWEYRIRESLRSEKNPTSVVLAALKDYPDDPGFQIAACFAAAREGKADAALRYLKRFTDWFQPIGHEDKLIHCLVLIERKKFDQADEMINEYRLHRLSTVISHLFFSDEIGPWVAEKLNFVLRRARERYLAEREKQNAAIRAERMAAKKTASKAAPAQPVTENELSAAVALEFPEFEKPQPVISVRRTIPDQNRIAEMWGDFPAGEAARSAFRLNGDLARLGLLQGYDELLCLASLRGIEPFNYQIETVRKALKQFRGRVLLADEVGLGKTIEAAMIIKEYLLRGAVNRVLILTPASLVGQWVEELAVKFDLPFSSTYDSGVRSDSRAFWGQSRIVASIATARRSEHAAMLSEENFDLVVVDEAHHLKNRVSSNWKLVDSLKKRFLLLLSATPVQNNLIELYNLLTLLKPGIFKTEKEFRAKYMTTGKPRQPVNREQLRDLMREVMIRNTRSLTDLRLPPRHAATIRVQPDPEETACYGELTELARHIDAEGKKRRMAVRHLLTAAGSTPLSTAAALIRMEENHEIPKRWQKLAGRYAALEGGAKVQALLELLHRNPEEKKLVFVHTRETVRLLEQLLKRDNFRVALFDGSLSGPEKDAAIERFQNDATVLLCTESGGEGRNLQFCNTVINFDLPLNPMAIEQRIGRIHRIGQTREVFVFNLAVRGTLEDEVLRLLDEKINMFELVVGELDAILGEMEETDDFSDRVLAAWLSVTREERESRFEKLAAELVEAKTNYDAVKRLDEALFGDDFGEG